MLQQHPLLKEIFIAVLFQEMPIVADPWSPTIKLSYKRGSFLYLKGYVDWNLNVKKQNWFIFRVIKKKVNEVEKWECC